MELRIKINPQHISGFDFIGRPRNHREIMNKIAQIQNTAYRAGNKTVVYNLEKHRKVVEQKMVKVPMPDRPKGSRATVMVKQHVVVTPAHWTANVYVFDKSVLHDAGLTVWQKTRHFVMKKFSKK